MRTAEDFFADDLRKVQKVEEPRVIPEIELVWVLAGRTSVLGRDVDKLKRPFDPQDDYLRMMRGIEIADQINALRAGKAVEDLTDDDRVTPIFYNGRAEHNEDLKKALEEGKLPYPKRLFIIESIPTKDTQGQVQGFKDLLSRYHYRHVAVVSSAFHLPRSARNVGEDSPNAFDEDEFGLFQNILASIKAYFFGIDREYKNPGTDIDRKCEPNAMKNYSTGFDGAKAPTISRWISKNTFLSQMDVELVKSFSLAKAAADMGLFSLKLPRMPIIIPKSWLANEEEDAPGCKNNF